MFNLRTFRNFVLALLLFPTCATWAQAAPIYQVTVDTRAYTGIGYLDLTFTGLAGATPATAILSHFNGSFRPASYLQGAATGNVGATVWLGNSQAFNELLQEVNLGGLFSFNVQFNTSDLGSIGTNFGVALVNAALDNYLAGTMGELAVISLLPGAEDVVYTTQGLSMINELPEPGVVLLFATGLVLLGTSRRKKPI